MRLSLPTAVTLLAACSGTSGSERLVTIDTLPGGIPLVISTAPLESGRWSLIHERDVQPGEGEPGELGAPADIALADDGTLYVVESSPVSIGVYGPDGRYLRSIGRSGGGPGEFNSAWIALRGDTIAIQDPSQARGTTINLVNDSVVSIRPTAGFYWYPIDIDGSGRAVARMMTQSDSGPPALSFIRFAMTGNTTDTVAVRLRPKPEGLKEWVVRRGGNAVMSMVVPLRPTDVVTPDPIGGFVTGWSGEYRIAAVSNSSDTAMVFGRPWTASAVTGAEKQAMVDEVIRSFDLNAMQFTETALREGFVPDAIPDQGPAFVAIHADPAGRRWVQLSTPDTATTTIDLFDPEGRWLDQIHVPADHWPRQGWEPIAFSQDRVATIGEDDDGLPLIRIYRIEHR